MSDEPIVVTCLRCGAKNRVRPEKLASARCGRCHTPLPSPPGGGGGQPVVVTDATFQREVLNAPGAVLVDLWAPWCAPCRMVAPVLKQIAAEKAGRLKIVKLDTDQNPRVASQLAVRSIPTLVLYRDGKLVDRVSGALPKPQLEAWLAQRGVV